ncbi:serpentine type 7TM GPCR chemoreceptor srsx domain-containing protein [Ditylenchus destructor]|nr:serpentine type 7TM GPCR chemoreceptor srsx domain-containing protein [Ditylenchus destructor]
MSVPNNIDDQFYLTYKDNFSWSLSLVAFFLYIPNMMGIFCNIILIYITIHNRSLKNSYNYLLAFAAVGDILHQISYNVTLYTVIRGQNFVDLLPCFYAQFYAVLGIATSFTSMFLLAFDRLVSVIFPLCKVICMYTTCFLNEAGRLFFKSYIIFNGSTVVCYIILWILMRKIATETRLKETRRIFKSLFIIMTVVVLGWMLNGILELGMPYLTRSGEVNWFVTRIGAFSVSVASSINLPILYLFNPEYKKVLDTEIGKRCSRVKPSNVLITPSRPEPARSSV